MQDRSNAQSSCAGLFIGAHLGFDFPGVWIHVDMAFPVHSVSDRTHPSMWSIPKGMMHQIMQCSIFSVVATQWFCSLLIKSCKKRHRYLLPAVSGVLYCAVKIETLVPLTLYGCWKVNYHCCNWTEFYQFVLLFLVYNRVKELLVMVLPSSPLYLASTATVLYCRASLRHVTKTPGPLAARRESDSSYSINCVDDKPSTEPSSWTHPCPFSIYLLISAHYVICRVTDLSRAWGSK